MRIFLIHTLLLLGLLSGCSALSGLFTGYGIDLHKDSKITLVYLGARDCHFCKQWEENEQQIFLLSKEFKHIEFLKIERNTFRRSLQLDDFPDDFKWLYESVKMDNSTPTFAVLVDKTVVLKVAGSNNWDKKIMPLFTNLIEKKSAARD
jgi:predicted bacteriocin transport accessory protein